MKSKSGQIEHWIEIPIKVNYTLEPAERMTLTYPGCEAHMEIDEIRWPTVDEMNKIVEKETDNINMACWENEEESP
jgi:hypothetical protein